MFEVSASSCTILTAETEDAGSDSEGDNSELDEAELEDDAEAIIAPASENDDWEMTRLKAFSDERNS